MNSVLLGNDIPPTPMGGYDYDELDHSQETSQQQLQQIKQS